MHLIRIGADMAPAAAHRLSIVADFHHSWNHLLLQAP
jgi:hypothetical protein